ncbi:MAG: CBS domain-containing protein [Candidatus Thiodiazotropha sp.]
MLVSEIMSKSPKTVSPDTKLVEVVSLMCLFRYSGLPVEEDGKLVGIIAEKDVLHRMFPTLEEVMDGMSSPDYDKMMMQYKDVVNLKVADLMSHSVISVKPDMHILRAATIMVRHKFRRIPVADGNQLLGMLSLGDIHKAGVSRLPMVTNCSACSAWATSIRRSSRRIWRTICVKADFAQQVCYALRHKSPRILSWVFYLSEAYRAAIFILIRF